MDLRDPGAGGGRGISQFVVMLTKRGLSHPGVGYPSISRENPDCRIRSRDFCGGAESKTVV